MNNQYVGKISVGEVLTYVFLTAVLIFTIVPLVFMVCASFMDAKQILAMPFSWIPSKEYFTTASRTYFTNFLKAVQGNHNENLFFKNLINSLIVAISTAASTIYLSALCGYGLAKFKFKGRNLVFMSIMSTMMIPFEAIMIPLYLVAKTLGIMNSLAGLVIPFATSAFGVFQMRQYLITFPSEYLDAARVDGLTEFGIFSRIVLPNSTPVMATLGIMTFRNQWDSLLWPMLCIQAEKLKTIPLYISKFAEEKQTDEGALMACALIASIPMIVLFFTMSKYFLGGAAVYESRKG